MNHKKHYMLVHPIETHRASNMEFIGARINRDLTEARADLRATKLMTKAAGLLTAVCLSSAAYEIGPNMTEASLLATAGIISGIGAIVGMRGSDVLEQREANLGQQLQAHTAANSDV